MIYYSSVLASQYCFSGVSTVAITGMPPMFRILCPVPPLGILSDSSLPAWNEIFLYPGARLDHNMLLSLADKYVTY